MARPTKKSTIGQNTRELFEAQQTNPAMPVSQPNRGNTLSHPQGAEDETETEDNALANTATSAPSNDAAARRLIYAQTQAGWFAADRIVFLYRPNIHTRQVWRVTDEGVIAEPTNLVASSSHTNKQLDLALLALKSDLSPATAHDKDRLVTSVIKVAEHIEGPVAGRIVRLLYRVANDPPFNRHPRITVNINKLMDELGYERDHRRGYHLAPNRERVRDALLALSRVEIRGERFDRKGGREVFSAPLIMIKGGYYRENESRQIPLSELLERGLPSELHIELGWYDGVRRADNTIGNNYLLLPRTLSYFQGLAQADHMRTEDLLAEFLWLRYSVQSHRSLTIRMTLGVALNHAGITNRNITRARQTLNKALAALQDRDQIESYTDLPALRSQSFEVTLRKPSKLSEKDQVMKAYSTLWDGVTATDSEAESNDTNTEAPSLEPLPAPFPSRHQKLDTEAVPPDSPYHTDGYQESPLAPEASSPTGSYLQVLRVGSYSLPAETAWQHIRSEAQHQLTPAVYEHLFGAQPLWRVDTMVDGDVQYWLHLGIQTGLRSRLQSSIDILQTAADHLYPQAFGVMLGARHQPPADPE